VALNRIGFPSDDSANVEWALILAAHQLADRHESLKEASDLAHERWIRLVRNIIAEGINAGEFRKELDPQSLAIEFAALFDGLGIYFYSKQVTSEYARRALDAYIASRLVSESPPDGAPETSSSIVTSTEPKEFSE
jgi:hypothetical protein